ncbi:MAG: undecaprenyldiphospho-muramoylpentapeptide beta-N-acetylglucosaminyltransferase [Candidatus Omnitrophica bacterium]|nr:undecaprenyldiphospho-muramoylpentapeptide beta-N-acetylglucosaminyltransferase [Candidatus Omnitrophota bacterium]
MESASLNVLLVAEGSGGHLIPALEVARALARRGARIRVWYAERRQTASLVSALAQEARDGAVELDPIPIDASPSLLRRLLQCGQLWRRARRCFATFSPDVVVGFGGWISAPVVLAAARRRIGCLLHEQNVAMGRTNRWLAPWVDRVALSFRETHARFGKTPSVLTGLPVRPAIGRSSRAEAAQRFGLSADRPTLLVLGGSQGARAINRLMVQIASLLSPEERGRWQILHLSGPSDEAIVKAAYAAAGAVSWVASFLGDMGAAYALADVVIARAGASTIAELARCGKPSILIPYPFAGGHQRANARLVEELGGGLMIEQSQASPERVLEVVRRLLADQRLRAAMGSQVRLLQMPDAADKLTGAIVELGRAMERRDNENGP